MQRRTRLLPPSIALGVLALSAACSSGGRSDSLAPAEPVETVRAFMTAVRDSNLAAMARLWGSSRGPASEYMDREELRKRLSIIQVYLQHDSYNLPPTGGLSLTAGGGRRGVTVTILRSGCVSNVPFTLIPWSDTWLVNDIELSAVGNPVRQCPDQEPGEP